MRDDRFTLAEISDLFGMNSTRMKEAFKRPDMFPAFRCGSIWVIPKDRFFAWYTRHRLLGTVESTVGCETLRHSNILRMRDEWHKRRMDRINIAQENLRRRIYS